MPDADELLTTAQVADEFGKTVATINRWADSGRLPVAKKLPGRTGANLYRRADVAAALVKPPCEASA